MNHPEDKGCMPSTGEGNPDQVIAEALHMINHLDNTPLSEMNPLFYQHWFEQLNMTVRDLLRVMGHDPDN